MKNLCTNEATFTLDAVFNTRNEHVWNHKSLYATTIQYSKVRFEINIWTGTNNNRFLVFGPSVPPPHLIKKNITCHFNKIFEQLV